MEREINEYCDMLWLSGVNVNGWTLIHNIEQIPSAYNGNSILYATDFGGLTAIKNDQLPLNKFIIIPSTVHREKRCKCCGQVIK